MDFRITGLPIESFRPLFGMSNAELLKQGARRYVADEKPGFPCRVSLEDAEPGETLLLVNYEHQPEPASPYRAKGPIFVREELRSRFEGVNLIPEQLRLRVLSVRAYDQDGLMVDADVTDGKELETLIARFFKRPDTAYIHAHFAKRGCYACRIDRA